MKQAIVIFLLLGIFSANGAAHEYFPLSIGNWWDYDGIELDTTLVFGEDTLDVLYDINGEIVSHGSWTVPAGTFDDVYQLHITVYLELSSDDPDTTIAGEINMDIWVARDVGPLETFQPATRFGDEIWVGYWEEMTDYEVPVEWEENNLAPFTFSLSPAHTNPFNPSTAFDFTLPAGSNVSAMIYDLNGRVVQSLIRGWRSGGQHRISFEAKDLPSAVYLLRFKAGDFKAVRKLILMK